MVDFEQHKGTNLKLKSASRSVTERSEIQNNGSTQHMKTLFKESFPLCQFSGIKFKVKSARRFKTERLESLKSFSKHIGQEYYSESFPPIASRRCYVVSSDLDFELNTSSDPLAKSGYKFVDILKASTTKLKYSWNKQMDKTSSKLTNFTCFFFVTFLPNSSIQRTRSVIILGLF